jgi:hypothetical protein
MTDLTLTDHERRAAEAGTLRYIVRPMEEQRYLTVSLSQSTGLWAGTIEEDGRTGFVSFESPHAPGDTLPTDPPLKVVGVEAMRLESILLDTAAGESVPTLVWDHLYGHRPDWRYESNPWCWVFEVKNG